jgi:uncharacterized protein YfbU (UPF0304 family)
MEEIETKKSRKKINKKKLDDLFVEDTPIVDNQPASNYKDKLRVYVLSGQITDLYGKIITENELNTLSEQECENIYKICELKTAKRISDSVIDGIVTVIGNLCSKILPIDDKDKYTNDLKDDYIINSELKTVAGNVAMRTGRLMGLLSFLIITGSHINFYRNTVKEVDNEIEKEAKELDKELTKELEK